MPATGIEWRDMRLAAISLALGALGFAIAAPQTAPDPEANAETAYKNIVSFKGEKAKEIIPAMHFMSASVGTGCDGCHVQGDFASDAKREKEETRKMITMTREINARNFGGRNVVTCNSCHNGMMRPAASPSAFPIRPGLQPDPTLKAEDVLAGASAAGAKGRALTLKLKGTATGHGDHAVEALQSSSGRFFVSVTGVYDLGYDGTTSWVNQGGKPFPVGAPDNTALLRYGTNFWGSPLQISEPVAGREKLGEFEYLVVRGKMGGVNAKMYFDAATAELRRVAYFDKTILGSLTDIYEYSDYKKVDGVSVPMTVVHHESATLKQVMKFTSAEVVVGQEALFSPH